MFLFPSFRVRPALTCFCLKLHLLVSWPCLLPPSLAERSLPPVILQPEPNLFPLDRENDFMTSRSQLLQGRRGILGGDSLQNNIEFFASRQEHKHTQPDGLSQQEVFLADPRSHFRFDHFLTISRKSKAGLTVRFLFPVFHISGQFSVFQHSHQGFVQ